MIRGEYNLWYRDQHICVPNHFTPTGMQQVVEAAFNQDPTSWYVGLCNNAPSDSDALAEIVEPTVGVNGYARVALDMDSTDWPTIGVVNNEIRVVSKNVVFTPTGAGFDVATSRLFITDGTDVISISSLLPLGLIAYTAELTTNYTLFFR